MSLRVGALLACAMPLCVSAQAPDGLIPKMREHAVNYSDRLQDFLCTQLTTRSIDVSGTGRHWKILETQESELGYIANREHYRVVKVNGSTRDPEKKIKKGYFRPGGEFGTSLMKIFDPKAAAEFEWDHDCVFRYRVPLATTTLMMNSDQDHVRMAHHGFVSADCGSGAVTRIQIETEPASVVRQGREMAIGLQLDVRYRPTTIASQEFLLPYYAVEMSPFGTTITKVEIQFQNYRKYEASSNITFDDKQ